MQIPIRFCDTLYDHPSFDQDITHIIESSYSRTVYGDDPRLPETMRDGFGDRNRVVYSSYAQENGPNIHTASMSTLSGREISPHTLWAFLLSAADLAASDEIVHEHGSPHGFKVSFEAVGFPEYSTPWQSHGNIRQLGLLISLRQPGEPLIDTTPLNVEVLHIGGSAHYIEPRSPSAALIYRRIAQAQRDIGRPVGFIAQHAQNLWDANRVKMLKRYLTMVLGENAYALTFCIAPRLLSRDGILDEDDTRDINEVWGRSFNQSSGSPYPQPSTPAGTMWDEREAPYHAIIPHRTAVGLQPPSDPTDHDAALAYAPLAAFSLAANTRHIATATGLRDIPIAYLFEDWAMIPHSMGVSTGETAFAYQENLTRYLNEVLSPIEALSDATVPEWDFYHDVMRTYNENASTRRRQRMLRQLRTGLEEIGERAIQDAKSHIEALQQSIREHRLRYLNANAEAQRLMAIVEDHRRNGGDVETNLTRLTRLLESSKIDSIHITDNGRFINVRTGVICAEDERTECWHRMGTYEFRIDTTNADEIRFYNEEPLMQGYANQRMQHPHIFEAGNACAGSHQEVFTELLKSREWPGLIMACIQFLESANTEDSAGQYVHNWPVCLDPWTHGYSVDPDSYHPEPYGSYHDEGEQEEEE